MQRSSMDAFELVKKQVQGGITPHAYLFYGTDNENKEKAVQYLKKEFFYVSYNDTTCLIELDEEPPKEINEEAL